MTRQRGWCPTCQGPLWRKDRMPWGPSLRCRLCLLEEIAADGTDCTMEQMNARDDASWFYRGMDDEEGDDGRTDAEVDAAGAARRADANSTEDTQATSWWRPAPDRQVWVRHPTSGDESAALATWLDWARDVRPLPEAA